MGFNVVIEHEGGLYSRSNFLTQRLRQPDPSSIISIPRLSSPDNLTLVWKGSGWSNWLH